MIRLKKLYINRKVCIAISCIVTIIAMWGIINSKHREVIKFKPFNTTVLAGGSPEIEVTKNMTYKNPYQEVDFVNYSDIEIVPEGEEFAEINIPILDINTTAYYGIEQETIDKHDLGISTYCGLHKRIIMCGHNTKVLGNIRYLENGDFIFIKTKYGVYTYCVEYVDKGTLTEDGRNIKVGDRLFIEDNPDVETLYIFTCVEGEENNRWVAEATLLKGTEVRDKPNNK